MVQSPPDANSCRACAEFCTVFANEIRARILWALRERECTVSELARMAETSIQNVSQHLRLMRDKGAIVSRREGKQVIYAVANAKFLEGMGLIRQGIYEEMQKRAQAVRPGRRRSTATQATKPGVPK